MAFDDIKGMAIAIEEARKGYEEGGVPIGGCLIHEDGTILGRGHNMRFQKQSAILHGEMSTLENAGRLPGSVYKKCTMYTTLSPCNMCSGACLMYGVKRVVLGENETFLGGEEWLKSNGIEVVNVNNQGCKDMMAKFIKERPQDWYEDIDVHNVEAPGDDPSLLTLILEIGPDGWFNLKNETSIKEVVKSLVVFLNSHLALNNSNQVAFILSTPNGTKFLYPSPVTDYDEDIRHDSDSDGSYTLIGRGMYRQFRAVDEAILQELNKALDELIADPPKDLTSKLSGALSLALTYTNRMLQLDQSISTTTASAIVSAANISNKESTSANGSSGVGSSSYGGSRIKARILVVTANDNEDIKYISLMNAIFGAQKMKVSMDIAKLGPNDSPYLQQAADATDGIYLRIEHPAGFMQVLSTAYSIEPSIRSLIILPTNSNVNYRASCFITGKSVEIGYVCSVCLCIMSIVPDSSSCPTCSSKFDQKLIARLKQRPQIKRRKLESPA